MGRERHSKKLPIFTTIKMHYRNTHDDLDGCSFWLIKFCSFSERKFIDKFGTYNFNLMFIIWYRFRRRWQFVKFKMAHFIEITRNWEDKGGHYS